MTTVYEIIKGINQAAANAYDGSHNDRYSYDGTAKKIGLKREEGDPIIDSRIIDGFGVKFHGNKLIITYQSELSKKSIHNEKYEDEIEQNFTDIVKFLKKEYKTITGNTLSLKPQGNVSFYQQSISNIRTWVQGTKIYEIGGLQDVESVKAGSPKDRLDKSIKKFLAIGKDSYPKAKKPKNVTRKAD